MPAEEIEKLAAAWLAREDRGLTAEETAALDLWLDSSSLHKVAYLRLKGTWRRADRLAALKRPAGAQTEEGTLFARGLLAIAAALLILLAGGWFWWHMPKAQSYATAVGQKQELRLADGSRLELNTNTRVHASVTASRRIVTLDAGEAYFDVVHDANRPFVVYAGNRRITDLGTKFSVFRNGDDVRVTVREGRVKVEILGQGSAAVPVVADGGHEVVTKGNETLILAKPDTEIANDLSWRNGILVFRDQPLAEAAEQFNRYNARQIVVEGNARRIRIGGSFRADNVDVFVLLLHRGFGLSVNDQGDRITVSR